MEGVSDKLKGIWGQFVVVVQLDEHVPVSEHESIPFDFADISAGWGVGPVDADVVSFVGAETVQLMPCVPAGAVVEDDPFPVVVCLGFQAGPCSGEHVGGGVVGAGDNRNHVGTLLASNTLTTMILHMAMRAQPARCDRVERLPAQFTRDH